MKSPPLYYSFLETPRAMCEYSLSLMSVPALQYMCPRGDGHPVIVFPGLGTSDLSTGLLRSFLRSIGYSPQPWALGHNLGPRGGYEKLISRLSLRLRHVSRTHDNQKVSLIGWSLGGIYAREIAKVHPELVRQVITLGAPFKIQDNSTNADNLYDVLSGGDTSYKDPAVREKLWSPPPVPFTSIYSKSDGIVNWEASIEDTGFITENIELLTGSHLGLSHNPCSLYVIADRLSQDVTNWQYYKK